MNLMYVSPEEAIHLLNRELEKLQNRINDLEHESSNLLRMVNELQEQVFK